MYVVFLYVRKPLSRQARVREKRAKQPVHAPTMAVRVLYANVCVGVKTHVPVLLFLDTSSIPSMLCTLAGQGQLIIPEVYISEGLERVFCFYALLGEPYGNGVPVCSAAREAREGLPRWAVGALLLW